MKCEFYIFHNFKTKNPLKSLSKNIQEELKVMNFIQPTRSIYIAYILCKYILHVDLCIYIRTFVIGSDESKDIVVPEHHRLVNFGLSKPRPFFARAEDFHSNVFASPTTTPHLAKPTFSDRLHQLNLAGYASLYQKRQAYLREDGHWRTWISVWLKMTLVLAISYQRISLLLDYCFNTFETGGATCTS